MQSEMNDSNRDSEDDSQEPSDDHNGVAGAISEPDDSGDEISGTDSDGAGDVVNPPSGDEIADDDPSEDDGQSDEPADVIDIGEIMSFASDGHSLADYAALYGISEDELIGLLLDKIDAQLATAVENGILTQAQADALLASAEEHLGALINGVSDGGENGHGLLDGENLLSLEVVAELTGTDVSEVEAALENGLTVAEFAQQYGVAKEDLVAALMTDIEARVNDAITSGELTQREAQQLLTDLGTRVTAIVNGEDPNGNEAPDNSSTPDGVNGDAFGSLDTIAKLTGTTIEDVMAAVMDGQSLVDFAAQHGVDESELIAAVAADVETQITANVENGYLTQAQADQLLANLDEIVTEIVNDAGLSDILDTLDECAPVPPTTGAVEDQTAMPASVCPAG